ncbi:MAG TPA: hypothetical protein VN253_24515 [Kofleriaceae bacterium]|nr:hypothetical protein [Kofleriaceae bacterium]
MTGMNVDTRILFLDGERAARGGELATARACFLEAAQAAVDVQLWRSALRCYRHALELNLLDREVIDRVLQIPLRVTSGRGWDRYRAAVDAHSDWARFGCRTARIVIGDLGAVVECPPAGPVLELIMSEPDLVEVRPDGRFAGMPAAMAMIILRRALWPAPRERAAELMTVRVTFDGHERVVLDEHGEWEPIVGDTSRARGPAR